MDKKITYTVKLFLLTLFLIISTTVYSDPSYQNLDPSVQNILKGIDDLGSAKFDPCQVEDKKIVTKASNCTRHEYVLWTGGAPGLTDLDADQVVVGITPAGVKAETEINKIGLSVDKQTPIWNKVSADYVKNLIQKQNEVDVYIGPHLRSGNTFCKTELPLILKNKPKYIVRIRSKNTSYNGRLISSTSDWPCGEKVADAENPDAKGTVGDGDSDSGSDSGRDSDSTGKEDESASKENQKPTSGSSKTREAALKLAQKALEALPGFSVAGKNLSLKYENGAFTTWIKKLDSTLTLFQDMSAGSKNWHAQLVFNNPGKFSFQSLGKELANDVLGNISASRLMLIISSADETVSLSNMTPSAKNILFEVVGNETSVELYKGINIFSLANVEDKGFIGGLKKVFQLENKPIKLGGQINKDAFEAILQKAGVVKKKSASDETLKTKLIVALPSITPLPYSLINDKSLIHMVYPSTKFTIERSKKAKSTSYEISGKQDVALWIRGKPLNMTNDINIVKSGKSYGLKVNGTLKLENKDLLGVEGLDVETVSLSGSVSQDIKKNNSKGLDISVDVVLPSKKELVGSFDLSLKGKKVNELLLSLKPKNAGKGLTLASLPVLKQFPRAKNVSLDNFSVGINPVNKDVYMRAVANFTGKGIIADATILHKRAIAGKGGVIMFLKTDGLNLKNLVPSLPAEMDKLTLDGGVMSLSVGEFTTSRKDSYPESLSHLFANLGGIPDMTFPNGVTINVPMDPARLPKNLGKALRSLGIKEPPILSGTIGGIFDGDVSLSLYGKLPKLPIPSIAGKPMKVKATNVGGSMFLELEASKAKPELKLGIDGELGVQVGKDILNFGGKVYIAVSSLAQGIKLSGRMDGAWNDPFGLVGITYKDMQITGGINSDSSLELQMNGTADFGDRLKYTLAGDVSAIMGSGVPVPKKLGIMFQGSELSMLTYVKIYSKLLKSAISGPLAFAIPEGETKRHLRKVANIDLISSVEGVVPLPYMIFKNPAFYLATPGASVPGFDDLGGLGGGIRGSLLFLGHNFGSVDNYLTLKNGLRLNTKPGNFNLGFLALKNAELDIKVPMPGIGKSKAYAKLTGDMSAGCSFIKGATDIFFNRDAADFDGNGKIGKYEASFSGHVNLKQFPKFGILGIFPKVKEIAKDITSGFAEWGKGAAKKVKEKKKKLENKVDSVKKELESEKNKLQLVINKEIDAKRNEINRKIKTLAAFVNARINDNKNYPVRRKAWEKVRDAVSKIRLSKDGFSIQGINEMRTALQAVTDMVSKLPGTVGKKIKDAINGRINKVKNDINEIANLVKNMKNIVNNLSSVKMARAKIERANKKFEEARKEAASVVLDPVLDTIDKAMDVLVIEKIGFDTGLEALCRKQLPRLNIAGRFKGQPFSIQNAVALPLDRNTDYSELKTNLAKLIKK